jgi:putative hydrolase of the HAD superfamily
MIRAFVFDIGNVILKFDFTIALGKLTKLCRAPLGGPELMQRIEEVKSLYEGGRIGRTEFLKQVFELVDFTGTELDFISAWEDIFEENTPVAQLVEQLHGKYPLYLLSNTSDIHMDYVLKNYPVFGRFTDAIYSYKVCCSKPERAIFELTVSRFGLVPQETVFIDDLPANVEAARKLGFQTIQYDFRNHESALEQLRSLGVAS